MNRVKQLVLIVSLFQMLNSYGQDVNRCYINTHAPNSTYLKYSYEKFEGTVTMGAETVNVEPINSDGSLPKKISKSSLSITVNKQSYQLNNNLLTNSYLVTEEIYPFAPDENIYNTVMYDFWPKVDDQVKVKETSHEASRDRKRLVVDKTSKIVKEKTISDKFIPIIGLIPLVEDLDKENTLNASKEYIIENYKGLTQEPVSGIFIKYNFKVKLGKAFLTPIRFVTEATTEDIAYYQKSTKLFNENITDTTVIDFNKFIDFEDHYFLIFLLNENHEVAGILQEGIPNYLYKLEDIRKCSRKDFIESIKKKL